jgi:hypothetical protein
MTAPIRPARSSDWPSIRGLLEARDLPSGGAETHLPDFLVATSETSGVVLGVAGLERYGDIGLIDRRLGRDRVAGRNRCRVLPGVAGFTPGPGGGSRERAVNGR